MVGGSLSRRHDKISIKQRHNRSFFECPDSDCTNIAPRENDDLTSRNSYVQSSELLSTSELISAAGHVWNRAREPLSLLLPKTSSAVKPEVIQCGDICQCSTSKETPYASISSDGQAGSIFSNRETNSSKLGRGSFEHLKVNEKSCFPYENRSLWKVCLANYSMCDGFYRNNCTLDIGRPLKLASMYGWMSKLPPFRLNNQENSRTIEEKMEINCDAGDCFKKPESSSEPSDTICSSNNLTSGTATCNLVPTEPVDLPYSEDSNVNAAKRSGNQIVYSQDIQGDGCRVYILRSGADCQGAAVDSTSHHYESQTTGTDDGLYADEKSQGIEFIKTNPSVLEVGFSEKKKSQYGFAKQEHAFAGAMAGVFVSLCLHPIDTVKTVIQSCRVDQKPFHHVGRSILSERGVIGLYRGISSNILTSAPISAVYTFTYESVKKTLLPFLPKEYHSLAHCTAGGCASIATSFIFTPSERIKQQMQVRSHYRNCWNALIEVARNGGIPSLYTGWGAVLCRNVPHSIIKFYSYESLKQIMLTSDAQTHTLVTLACGGLAGSTASLFTTPFDVVKTRLQTQIPGCMTQYNGIFNTLRDIWKHEGLKGLYKGLTPRMVMYMIQGALFFASYESFKSLFSLEQSQTVQEERKIESDSLPSTAPVTA